MWLQQIQFVTNPPFSPNGPPLTAVVGVLSALKMALGFSQRQRAHLKWDKVPAERSEPAPAQTGDKVCKSRFEITEMGKTDECASVCAFLKTFWRLASQLKERKYLIRPLKNIHLSG